MKVEDIDAVIKLYNYHVENTTATLEEHIIRKEDFAANFQKNAKSYPYLIAESEDKTIAFAYAQAFNLKSAYRFTAETTVYISKEFAGKGIGSALYGKLILACKRLGFEQLIALISLPNPASVRLHEKHGFKSKGILEAVGFKFEKKVDVLMMQVSLTE